MVSRRNYITIAIMFLILFFMFQFTGVMKEQLSEYGTNEYEMPETADLKEDTAGAKRDDVRVVFIGNPDDETAQVTAWWCTYRKYAQESYASLTDWKAGNDAKQTIIAVIDGKEIETAEEIQVLREAAEQGIHLIFATLPKPSVIAAHENLQQLLGIRSVVSDTVTLDGVHLFDGFLLGGEALYEAEDEEDAKRQDLELTIPWYVTGAGTKTYMMGTLSDEKFAEQIPQLLYEQYGTLEERQRKNQLLPAIIWRNGAGNGKVFGVNGSYFSEIGIGILDAMLAELQPYTLYPIVNAQNLVAAGFPAFAAENTEEMKRRYSQSMDGVYREVIWPSMSSLAFKTRQKPTFLMTPQYDYSDDATPDTDEVTYYLKLFKEIHAEAGYSTETVSALTMQEKLNEDITFWKEAAPDYAFLSAYAKDAAAANELADAKWDGRLRTVAIKETDSGAYAPIFELKDALTAQCATSRGTSHTYADDLRVKSIETALGYSNIVLDFLQVAYPVTEEDSWEKLGVKTAKNIATYWKPFQAFAATTLSESDQRIRRFLALNDTAVRKGDTITIQIDHFEDAAWFLLRDKNEEIVHIEGGTWEEVEADVYLIEAQADKVVLTLRAKPEWQYPGMEEKQEQQT